MSKLTCPNQTLLSHKGTQAGKIQSAVCEFWTELFQADLTGFVASRLPQVSLRPLRHYLLRIHTRVRSSSQEFATSNDVLDHYLGLLAIECIAYIIANYRQTAQSDLYPILSHFQSITPKSDRTTTINDKENPIFKILESNSHILSKRAFNLCRSEEKILNYVFEPEKRSDFEFVNLRDPRRTSTSELDLSPQTEKVSGDPEVEISSSQLTPSKESNGRISNSEPTEAGSRSSRFLSWISPVRFTPPRDSDRAFADGDPKEARSQSLRFLTGGSPSRVTKKSNKALADCDREGARSQSSRTMNSKDQLNIFRSPTPSKSNEKSKPIHSESVNRVAQKVGAQVQTIGGGSSFRKSFTWPSTSSKSNLCGFDGIDFVHSPVPINRNGKMKFVDGNRSGPPKKNFQSYMNREIAHKKAPIPKPLTKGSTSGTKHRKSLDRDQFQGRNNLLVINEDKQT
ncbi:hypothetical protein DFH28DRAFT_922487 [Melampsora americana]|nr:hypothetical protein DFH28DRAFT_922487 [Melampsora americana]